jgi:hypothetical protein
MSKHMMHELFAKAMRDNAQHYSDECDFFDLFKDGVFERCEDYDWYFAFVDGCVAGIFLRDEDMGRVHGVQSGWGWYDKVFKREILQAK